MIKFIKEYWYRINRSYHRRKIDRIIKELKVAIEDEINLLNHLDRSYATDKNFADLFIAVQVRQEIKNMEEKLDILQEERNK